MVLQMRWSEIHWKHEEYGGEPIWIVKGDRTKNEADLITPLSKAAVALLREEHENRISDDVVFVGRDMASPMSNMTMLKLIKTVSGDPSLTVHGSVRTTFRSWGQDGDFDDDVLEHCMHHIKGDEAAKAYKQGKAVRKRKQVFEAWADYLGAYRAPLRMVA
jgi:integrase